MSFLYKNASGREIQHASYSAIADFDYCPQLFKLSRVEGFKDTQERGAFAFGKCIEDAIQYFHSNGCKEGDAVDEFKRLWLKFKDIPMVFTAQENSWADCYTMGAELEKLYEVLLPTLPIKNPKFQLNYKKALWPGSEYADLEFTSFIDLLSTLEDGSRIIVDIKSAKTGLDISGSLLALDPQLKDYAWASGIRDVAFLWLVKASNPGSFKKGTDITLLEEFGDWKAGAKLVVVKYEETEESKRLLVGTEGAVQIMDEAMEKITGTGSKAAKEALTAALIADATIQWVSRDIVTKTKLQWIQGKIPAPDIPEAGQHIGNKMIQIKTAYEQNSWPRTGGVRFPNMKCTFCRMRGNCTGNKQLQDQLVRQITPAANEPDWLDDLEEEAA